MVKVLDRESINRMTRNSGRGGSTYVGGGGGGGYTLPLAADGVRGGVQLGYTTDATARKYAVQLDGEKAYVNVPWTDHYAWSDITGTPTTVAGYGITDMGSQSVSYATSAGSASRATTAGTATYANSAGSASSADYATSAGSAGSAGYAGYITDGTMDAIAQYNNELNFGGSDGSSTIYFGYRARGSKGIPTSFIFGGGSGSASITCNGLYSNSYVTALSDARKKNVLSDVILSAEQLAQMPAVRFEWKDPEKPGTFIGTLAQSWREILPEAIHTISPDDDTLTFDYQSAALVAVVNLAREIQDIKMKLKRYGFK